MPKHFVLNTFITILLGVSFGYGVTSLMKTDDDTNSRFVASFQAQAKPNGKLGLDQASYDYLDIKIDNESVAEKLADTSIVRAKFIALKDIPSGLSYKWILGRDVLTSEILIGQLDAMKAGDVKDLSLRVTNYSKEIQAHVSIMVNGQIGNHPVIRDAIVSSRPEDSFEYVVQKNENLNQQKPGKGLQKAQSLRLNEKFRADKIFK